MEIEIFKEFQKTSFGLELETCVHMIGNKAFRKKPKSKKDGDRAIKEFYSCMKNRFNVRWKLILDEEERADRYDQWIIMPDISIQCNSNLVDDKYCVIDSRIVTDKDECEQFVFYPVEIVTPKLTGRLGLQYLTVFWNGVLLGEDMVYSVNETQGLHTNISNPNMNVKDFIYLWTYFEPAILQMLDEDRRASPMAPPHSAWIKNLDIMELAKEKFVSVGIKAGKSPRLEVRIKEGSFDFEEVINWTVFCMLLLSISIVGPKKKRSDIPDFPEYMDQNTKIKLLDELFSLIRDDTTIKFLLRKYKENKDDKWPDYDYKGPTMVMFPSLSPVHLPDEIRETILRLRSRKCNAGRLYKNISGFGGVLEEIKNNTKNEEEFVSVVKKNNLYDIYVKINDDPENIFKLKDKERKMLKSPMINAIHDEGINTPFDLLIWASENKRPYIARWLKKSFPDIEQMVDTVFNRLK